MARSQYKLVPRELVFVEGKIHYSAIGSIIQGRRLQQINNFGNRNYPLPPHTRLELDNPKIFVPKGQTENDSSKHVADSFYMSKRDNVSRVTLISKVYNPQNYRLPWVAVTKKGTHIAKQYKLHQNEELAAGQTAIAVLRAFGTNKGNNGITLAGVVVPGDANFVPQTTSFGANTGTVLQQLGLTLEGGEPQDNPQQVATVRPSQLPSGISQAGRKPYQGNQNGQNGQNNTRTYQNGNAFQNNTYQNNNGSTYQNNGNTYQNGSQNGSTMQQNSSTYNNQGQSMNQNNGGQNNQSANNDPTPDPKQVKGFFDVN